MDEFAFRPTHVAPPDGMATWTAPDPARPSARLDPLLPVRLIARQGDWAQILCSNGWTAWVDGRLLVALPQPPPAAGGPPARTADPRPALAEAETALARHRALLEDLAAGTLDLEAFRARTRGQRIGLVADGEALWVFDPVHDRWCYCDGLQLQTYAATDRPPPAPVSTPVSPVPAAPRGAATAAPTASVEASAKTSTEAAPTATPAPGSYAPTRTGEP
ncbi:hypothetical protein ACFV1W_33970 [Kitasatospora sp. NPDC059648]|uniref:hypothetical protein n=1 Tax=Kitasatospora sp. NPDC059648 TaxID=3346894 RepID=UPI0036A9B13E